MANTAFGHDATLTTPGSTTNTALVRWANTSGSSLNNTANILSDGSHITLNARGEVRFADADSSHYIALEAPATVGTTYTMALPAAVPSANDYLKVTSYSGGAGVLEWATAGGGDLSFGGDTFGADKVIGSNDDYDLAFETNGTTRVTIANNGAIGVHATTPTISNAIQVGDGENPGMIQHYASDYMMYACNAYYDGAWRALKQGEHPMALRFFGADSSLTGLNFSIGKQADAANAVITNWDGVWDSANSSTTAGIVLHIPGDGAYGGNVGIGTTAPQMRLHVEDTRGNYLVKIRMPTATATNGIHIEAINSGTPQGRWLNCKQTTGDEDKAAISANGDFLSRTNSYGGFSDERLKENIVNASSSLSELMKLKIKDFNLINSDETQRGVIAQEFLADGINIPSFIRTLAPDVENPDGLEYYTAAYNQLIPWLVQAIQELNAKIDAL